jgi:ferredoxin
MRLQITAGRCQGHARCASLVPEVFDLDDDGYAIVLAGHELIAADDDAARARVQLAIDNCPEQAIVLSDDG